jgi:hypothetical protein
MINLAAMFTNVCLHNVNHIGENPYLREDGFSLMGGRNDRNKRSSASNRPRTQIQNMTYKKYAYEIYHPIL